MSMPLVRIDLLRGKSAEFRRAVGDVVYEAMLETIKVPQKDRFQVISEHSPENFIYDPSYAGIERSDGCIFIQVTLSVGRTVEAKQSFYRRIADELHRRLGVRREDVFINLVEVVRENWSFGNGVAQYVT
jgi:phenylpyruvate tautomerase PptA (4-oxalocrotonate tautomerase family)